MKDIVEKARTQVDDFQLQYKAGKRSVERGDHIRARQFLGRAANLSSGKPSAERIEILTLLSIACFKDGKYQDSLRAMDDLEKIEPKLAQHESLRFQRARVLIALKKHEEGYQILNALVRSSVSRTDC